MFIQEHNCETNEIILRELNDEELAQRAIDQADAEARIAEDEAREAARQAIADRLGLTADELKLLLG